MKHLPFHPNRDKRNWSSVELAQAYFRIIKEEAHLPTPRDVLDVGCGNGYFVMGALNEGANVYGVDLRPEIYQGPKERLIITDATARLPFENESFDLVVDSWFSLDLLELQREKLDLIYAVQREFARILRPGGIRVGFPDTFYTKEFTDRARWHGIFDLDRKQV